MLEVTNILVTKDVMTNVTLADAKAHLSELVAQAEAGDAICITRHGKPAARLTAVVTPRAPIALSALRELTASMPAQSESAADFVREMRDDSRY